MSIIKEYRCAAHGEFEATEPQCPQGCSTRFVKQEIRTAPAYHNGRTKRVDQELDALASTYGMTNIRSDKDSGSVMDQLRKADPSHQTFWKDVPHSQPGWTQRQEAPVTITPGAFGLQGDNVTEQVKSAAEKMQTPLVGPTLQASEAAKLIAGRATVEECQ